MPPHAVDPLPDPGPRLISRVTSGPDREAFHASGRRSVEELQRTLAIAGRRLDGFRSILDFGCGCGRMLIWLADLADTAQLHGTDIDPEAIAWCAEHLPYARFAVNGAEPPTAYEDGAFDLIVNHSVFTHLDAARQDAWLNELHRITRPGALLVLSVHGEAALPAGAWEIRDRLERDGIAFMDGTVPSEIGLPSWYQNTWHAPWYLFEHWQRWFRIRAYVPGGSLGLQDELLLERLEGAPPPPLSARVHGHSDPRRAAEGARRRVHAAFDSLERYTTTLTDPPAGGVRARVRQQLRRGLLASLRPYTFHQQKFNRALLSSLDDLSDALAASVDPGPGPPPPGERI